MRETIDEGRLERINSYSTLQTQNGNVSQQTGASSFLLCILVIRANYVVSSMNGQVEFQQDGGKN